MHLLLCTTPDQANYLQRFSRLSVFHGHRVSVLMSNPDTLSALEHKCKAMGVEGILLANQQLLDRALNGLLDFRPPIRDKTLSLNDYQGSFISIKGIPTVVLNPPEHIMTVPHGAYVFSRFIQKLTKPTDWFPQTKFSWTLGTPENLPAIYDRFAKRARLIAIDIETPEPDTAAHTINCICFAAYYPVSHTSEVVVIPFTDRFMLSWVRNFCDLPTPKVLQGGTYDAVRLLRFNCPIRNYLYDTLNLFHSYYSELPKDLGFISAFALREIRFWKDDGKTGNLEDYYRYNGLDGWGTLNACLSLILELPSWAIRNYLTQFPLIYPAIHCELEGWRVDPERFMKVKKEQTELAEGKLKSLRKMLSAPEYKPTSWQQNRKVFAILGCADLPSTNEANMKKAEFRHPLNARIIGGMRDVKKASKLVSTYCDENKIWQFSAKEWRLFYRINPAGTDTGRLASSESSFWIGYQIQNIKRGPTIKQYLVADPNWKLAEPDFEQSEARCTFYLAGEQKGIDLVESGKDYHCYNAELFFGIPYIELWDEEKKQCRTPEAKYIRDEPAKRTNHGANYNMTGGVMLDTMGPKAVAKVKATLVTRGLIAATTSLKDTCQWCLDRYAKTYPNVKTLWYNEIIRAIELTKKLVSPLGWTRHFFGDPKHNKHHLNAAVAHGPQNLSVGIINKAFYRIWWESIYGEFRNFLRLKAQIHDSIPFQYRADAEWVPARVKELMRIPVEVKGADGKTRTLVIPVGMSYGKDRWSELK